MQPEQADEERLERIQPAIQDKNNENDTLWVKNIDEDCHDITYDSVRVSERWRDPESGRVMTQFKDVSYEFEHAEGFQVRWSGQPFTLKPGETARMPRFLAEHFATHLANHILDKRGAAKKRALRNDPIERPRVLKEIIIKEEPFFSTIGDSVGTGILKQVTEMNEGGSPITEVQGLEYKTGGDKGKTLAEADATPTDNIATTTGRIDKTSVEPTGDVILRIGSAAPEDGLNVPEEWQQYSKPELIEQIRNMDPYYKFGSQYTKAQLVSVLTHF
jgi:hypothetical protein